MEKKNHFIPTLEIVLAMILVGSSVIAGKIITEKFPVFFASAASLFIALIAMTVVQIFTRTFSRISARDALVIGIQAFLGIFLFRIFLLYGLRNTTAIEAGIITSSSPALYALFAWILLREKIGRARIFAVVLSIVGIVLLNVIGSSGPVVQESHVFGNFLILGTVFGEVIFTLCRKFVSPSLSVLSGAWYLILFGLILFLPFGLNEMRHMSLSSYELIDWMAIFYNGLIVTALSYLLWFHALRHVPASAAGIFTAIIPCSAVLLSIIVLGEPLLPLHVLAGAFVVIAIVITMRAKETVSIQ